MATVNQSATRSTNQAANQATSAAARQETKAIHREMEEALGLVPEFVTHVPDAALPGFWSMFRDVELAETKIPNKYKELIGLAVAGATRCRYCVLFHTEAARLFGATDEEIAEASMMGAFSMLASTFLNAQAIDHERFRQDTLAVVAFARKNAAAKVGGARETAAHA